MTKYRKRNRRKCRHNKRDTRRSPAGIPETEIYDIGPDEMEKEIKDLLRVPGAVMWFFNEKGELQTKIKIEA